MKYLIFDFDGVIADTLATNLQTRINVGAVKNMDEAIAQMNNYFDNKPVHTRNHTLIPEEMKKVDERIFTFGKEIARLGFPMFDGFIEEIKKVNDAKVAIVSTGVFYVRSKSIESGLNPTHVLTYEDHHSKEEKIERICKDWKVSVKDIYYFTDSRADVFELEHFLDRRKIIGVSWGYCGYEKLRQLLPENQILKNFTDIHKVLE